MRRLPVYFVILFVLRVVAAAPPPTTAPSAPRPLPTPYLLHLPGVAGEAIVDHAFVRGLQRAKLDATIEIYDWTENDPGVPALQAYARNGHEAQLIADKVTAKFRADPRITIYLTCHSGGAGLAIWALAKLPDDVQVDSLLMLAPALSPDYDLTPALRHVRRAAYSFCSQFDTVVLSIGTRTFGTIDGVHSDSAGYVGFTRPPTADAQQYAKLVQFPYDKKWMALNNNGDHIGPMSSDFAKSILAPLLLHGPAAGQTTQPAALAPATPSLPKP